MTFCFALFIADELTLPSSVTEVLYLPALEGLSTNRTNLRLRRICPEM